MFYFFMGEWSKMVEKETSLCSHWETWNIELVLVMVY